MGKHYTLVRGDRMECSLWLVFHRDGSARMTRGQPDLSRDERAIALTVKLPMAIFRTPALKATLTIDAPEPVVPPIDLTAASEALKSALGVDVEVRLTDASE